MKAGRLLACAAFLALSVTAAAAGQPKLDSRPHFVGETLRFAMSILGAAGGELTLSAKETQLDGKPAYKFELSAISGEFLSKIFLVRDYLASWVDPKTFRSMRFEKHTVEGKRVRDDLIEFDYPKKIAYRDGKPIPIEENTFDTLSSIYYIRLLDLDRRDPVPLTVVSRRLFPLSVVTRGRETVTTPAGTFRTIRVEPQGPEGLIGKGKTLTLWLTDDERKMPVQLKSKLKVGTLTGKLKAIETQNPPAE
ncbi:MAG TPA: DUF3108 domain-containing protein [Thermoanaerobaculia bacterium]|nr:DUF3108 domain-containing protein [Thermoanaerobaculia bacterium]